MFIYKKKPFIILFLYVLFPFRNIDTMSNTLSQEELKRKQEVANTFELLKKINLKPALKTKIITILKKQSFFIFKCENESLKKSKASIENNTANEQISIMKNLLQDYYYYSTQGKQEGSESIDILYKELDIGNLYQNLQNNTIPILKYLTKEKIKRIKEIEKITEDNKDKFLQSLEGKIELIRLFIKQVENLKKTEESSQYINNLKQLFNQHFNLNPFINASRSNKYRLDIFYNTLPVIENVKEYTLDDLMKFTYFFTITEYINNTLYYSDNEIEKDKVLIYCNKINSLYKILYKTSSNNLVNPKKIIEKWIDKLSIDTNQQTDQENQNELIDIVLTTDQQTDQGKSIDISTKDQGKLREISSNQKIDQENQNKTNPLWYMLIGIIIFVVSVLIYIFTKTKKPLPNEIIDGDLDNEANEIIDDDLDNEANEIIDDDLDNEVVKIKDLSNKYAKIIR
jgi:hypothetical protein